MKPLNPEQALLLIIDVQTKLVSVMSGVKQLIGRLIPLIKGIQLLNIPMIYTEQYPKGLGPTIPEILDLLPNGERFEKQSFSCCLSSDFNKALQRHQRHQILVAGIEAHVCVFQTCQDLLRAGYDVYLIADAIASRRESDQQLAIRVLETSGIHLRSTEMALFELLRTSRHEKFKEISTIIKQVNEWT